MNPRCDSFVEKEPPHIEKAKKTVVKKEKKKSKFFKIISSSALFLSLSPFLQSFSL
jgi:hypothetical protein